MIGRNRKGGFNTSPTAAYPPGMCRFIAARILDDFLEGKKAKFGKAPTSGFGGADKLHRGQASTPSNTPTSTPTTRTKDRERSYWKPGGRAWLGQSASSRHPPSDDEFAEHIDPEELFLE